MQALPMNRLIPLALALLAAPVAAQPAPNSTPKLSLAQEAALRCSATFAKVASDQARKVPGWERYPALGTRGREFFVRTTAQLMDQTGVSRETVVSLLKVRYDELQARAARSRDPVGMVGDAARACLPLLDAEVPLR